MNFCHCGCHLAPRHRTLGLWSQWTYLSRARGHGATGSRPCHVATSHGEGKHHGTMATLSKWLKLDVMRSLASQSEIWDVHARTVWVFCMFFFSRRSSYWEKNIRNIANGFRRIAHQFVDDTFTFTFTARKGPVGLAAMFFFSTSKPRSLSRWTQIIFGVHIQAASPLDSSPFPLQHSGRWALFPAFLRRVYRAIRPCW